MLKNNKLSKVISEIAWSEFRIMLEYKVDWYVKEIKYHTVNIDKFQKYDRFNMGGILIKPHLIYLKI